MKKILTVLTLLLAALSSSASLQAADRTVVTRFIESVSAGRVSFNYAFSALASGVKISGNGAVLIQDDAFYLEANGLEVWCDGVVRWTIDRAAEEAYIENVADSPEIFAANPALMITRVDEAFSNTSVTDGSFNGAKVTVASFTPKKDYGFTSLKLYFSGDKLAGASATVKDGTVTDFVITDFKCAPKQESLSAFKFDEGTLGKNYVITDLR